MRSDTRISMRLAPAARRVPGPDGAGQPALHPLRLEHYLPRTTDHLLIHCLPVCRYLALIMVLASILSVYFASSAFIVPLERLAIKLKNKTTTAATVRGGSDGGWGWRCVEWHRAGCWC